MHTKARPAFRLPSRRGVLAASLLLAAPILTAHADTTGGFLEHVHRHSTLISTVPDNGDQNPYAIVIAPVSAGKVAAGDVLVDNFNDLNNLQGTGSTVIGFRPATRAIYTLAALDPAEAACPGGLGLSTAMTMLRSGWIIVGSTPSKDGTTGTRGPGCLIVLDPTGKRVATWTGADINGPWGNMAVADNGTTATLFVSMAGFDIPAPGVLDPATGEPVVRHKATILRLTLSIPAGQPPGIASRTVIAEGFGARSDRGVFMIGPTGLALAPDGTLYASDAVGNSIAAIDNALVRTTSAGTGRVVTQGGLLLRPLALTLLPNGHLLSVNARNGEVVETDPAAGKQLYAQWIDTNQAQSPPGNGDLFGIAVAPDGHGFFYVQDDMNTLVEAR